MKIDCEGAEPLILAGGEGFFGAKRVDFISLDYHTSIVGEKAAKAMDGRLRDWGYVLTKAANRCWVYHLPGLESVLASLGQYEAVPPL